MNRKRNPKHPQMDRIRFIYAKLNSGRGFTANDLITEMEVSWRTAMRDIEYVRERCDVPIFYDREKQSYVLPPNACGISFYELDGYHCGLLALMLKQFEGMLDDEMHRSMDLISETLAPIIGPNSSETMKEVEECILVANWRNKNFLKEDVWILLTRAMRTERLISFQDHEGKSREVEPWYVVLIEGLPYLLYRDAPTDSMGFIGLGAMQELDISNKTFELDPHFYPEDVVEKLLVFAGDKKVSCVVENFQPVGCSDLELI